jgi:hypothetical protein
MQRVRVAGDQFCDSYGRTLILRGVNLGGDCKVPYPNGGTNYPTDFSDHRSVSFVGRPFPLDEAREHLGRLKHWGFNCLRLLTTWEAIEHEGPGLYDAAYLDYFTEVCRLAGEYGFHVFIDFHQDVWSRMTGGDGAPGWIFEALGLDFTKFHEAGAAHVMQYKYDYARGGRHDENYPPMSWTWNYRLPANGIMWTLFWAGDIVVPQFRVDGRGVGQFLQDHYLGAMDQVARRVKDLPCVLGFDTLNEPSPGWIGLPLSYRHLGASAVDPLPPPPGPVASPLDQLVSAQGIPVSVPSVKRDPATRAMYNADEIILNPNGASIWRDGCPFEKAGIYRVVDGKAEALSETIFQQRDGVPMTISDTGYGPFFARVAETIRAYCPDWAVFAEIDPYGSASGRGFPQNMPERSVNAGHWYDVGLLHSKKFDSETSADGFAAKRAKSPDEIRKRYTRQLGQHAEIGRRLGGGAPSLVGEFGTPFDLNEGEAYRVWRENRENSDSFSKHTLALGLMYDAIDALHLHSTQWNYTASNRNDPAVGDGWNQEDLSIFSRDQQRYPQNSDSGGRGVEGFCRPYARAVQGRILKMHFDRETRLFELVFDAAPAVGAPTEIYVPRMLFPLGVRIVCDGCEALEDPRTQTVLAQVNRSGPVRITIAPR